MDRKSKAVLLGILVLLLASALLLDRAANLPARVLDAFVDRGALKAKQVSDAFVQLFQLQPRITVNNHLYSEQTKTALELAIVSRDTEVTRETSQTWLGSTKRIRVHGTYRVKAGFALPQNVDVDVSDQRVTVRIPRATILDVEQLSVQVEQLQNGLWNQIQAQDVENELKTMPDLARLKEKDLPDEAQEKFRELLSAKLANLPLKIEIESANIERR